jgi:redox-sensitive bicupin YhaK (pirin superfamily)
MDAIEQVLETRSRDLGEFVVRRVLPSPTRRMVGPFIFFDHMGPVRFPPGNGVAVRPHPHIGIATLTYLFEGTFVHRDSLGSNQPIAPGDVNWMVAGSGVVHSERSSPRGWEAGGPLHGLQTWLALPDADEQCAPSFEHHPKATIPQRDEDGVHLAIVAGSAYGRTAPAGVRSPTLYVHAQMAAGSRLAVDDTHPERAIYVVVGAITVDDRTFGAGSMVVLRADRRVVCETTTGAAIMLVGGSPVGPRHIDWNFVASTKERIATARDMWQRRQFPAIPGDDVEFIPLPES